VTSREGYHLNRPPIYALTPQEWVVVRGMAQDRTYREIAISLGSSEQTVKNHAMSARQKLGAETRIGLLRALGWLRVPGEQPVEYLSAAGMVPV
jgi:DNA-binding NarL/FixJ family response regulator